MPRGTPRRDGPVAERQPWIPAVARLAQKEALRERVTLVSECTHRAGPTLMVYSQGIANSAVFAESNL